MALPYDSHLTEAEYLAFERKSDTKHEYVAGEVLAMTGASWNHNIICANLSTTLNNQLTDSPCVVVASDMRLKVAAAKSYRYPDVMIVCDEPQFVDERVDTIKNPTVIIEVLSPSTALIDRNEKLREYRRIDTLQVYLLVSQHEPRIERYMRQSESNWLYTDVTAQSIEIPPLKATLVLSDVYKKIEFDEEI